MKVLLDGTIASGKSYFLNKLKEKLDNEKKNYFVEDSMANKMQINNLDILKKAYLNPKQWAFICQLLFLKIFNEREEEKNNSNHLILHSRSIHSVHRVFNYNHYNLKNITDEEFIILNEEYQNLFKSETNYDYLIFFDCDFKTSIKRTEARTTINSGVGLSNVYLKSLNELYKNLLSFYRKMPFKKIFVIKTDSSDQELLEKEIESVINFLIKERN